MKYGFLHMNLPVVEAAVICKALIHGTVDGGLGSLTGTFDQHHKGHQ